MTRKTAWEAPAGEKVVYASEAAGGGGGGGSGGGTKKPSSGGMMLLISFLAPILLPILGLAVCYWRATKEGLAEALKGMKAKREKARKRRGASAGGNFRPRQKLSQDGKGGRSANS